MKIKSERDFFAGIMFFVVGGGFAWGATNYTIGTGARMGPGYFPLLLGVLLAVLGLAIILESLVVETEDGEKVGAIGWRPLFFIIASNVVFGILLGGLPAFGVPAMGLIIAIYGVVFISSLAADTFRFKEVAILATILAIGSYFTFVWALALQFPVWPSFITG